MMTPEQYCHNKAVASGSSFTSSFCFLPKEKRLAMLALYAFCREVDDIVDETLSAEIALRKLVWWRADVEKMYQGLPEHPVQLALLPHVKKFDLPQSEFIEIIDGMQMDLQYNRYPDFASLRLYCHRVAGVVGRISARIFGFTDEKTLQYAEELGLAFQLTNIIRDVGEDARRARIYLPQDELRRFNVNESDILDCKESPAFNALILFQIARAEQCYRHAWDLLPKQDMKAQRVGLVMAAIYRATLTEIKLDNAHKVLSQRLSLKPLRKIWLAWSTWMFGYRP